MMIKTIIQEYCLQSGEKATQYKNSRRYIIMMMFDLRGKPKRQLQSITSRIIISKIKSNIEQSAE